MASYKINLEGGASFDCADDVYILDAAEEAGVDLPPGGSLTKVDVHAR